jgi:hypothetical protein
VRRLACAALLASIEISDTADIAAMQQGRVDEGPYRIHMERRRR